VFTARYALSTYIKRKSFVFKVLAPLLQAEVKLLRIFVKTETNIKKWTIYVPFLLVGTMGHDSEEREDPVKNGTRYHPVLDPCCFL